MQADVKWYINCGFDLYFSVSELVDLEEIVGKESYNAETWLIPLGQEGLLEGFDTTPLLFLGIQQLSW